MTTAHDDRDRSQAVLLIDECECGASSDWVLAHTSLSANSAASPGTQAPSSGESGSAWATAPHDGASVEPCSKLP